VQPIIDANLFDLASSTPEPLNENGELPHQQSRVGLSGRAELGIDAEVNLEGAALEPRSAPARERGWLRDLGYPEEPRIELAGRFLPARRHRELDVVDADDLHVVEP
jgi:hypothetical protein